jgi:hypothetical protein
VTITDPVDQLRAEHPGEPIFWGVSYGWDGPPTHSVAEAFFGTGPDPGPNAGTPIVWVRTEHTAWIRVDTPAPARAPRVVGMRRASVAELRRWTENADRKAAEAQAKADALRARLLAAEGGQ